MSMCLYTVGHPFVSPYHVNNNFTNVNTTPTFARAGDHKLTVMVSGRHSLIRLLPGHSHNEGDANHRRVLQVFYPKGHVGPGCQSPWEFHRRIVDGLKEMNEGCEMLWLFTSLSQTANLFGHVCAEDY